MINEQKKNLISEFKVYKQKKIICQHFFYWSVYTRQVTHMCTLRCCGDICEKKNFKIQKIHHFR